MRVRARRAAVRELKAADRELNAASQNATSDTEPAWAAANQRVSTALDNPDLPYRHPDPADRGPRWHH